MTMTSVGVHIRASDSGGSDASTAAAAAAAAAGDVVTASLFAASTGQLCFTCVLGREGSGPAAAVLRALGMELNLTEEQRLHLTQKHGFSFSCCTDQAQKKARDADGAPEPKKAKGSSSQSTTSIVDAYGLSFVAKARVILLSSDADLEPVVLALRADTCTDCALLMLPGVAASGSDAESAFHCLEWHRTGNASAVGTGDADPSTPPDSVRTLAASLGDCRYALTVKRTQLATGSGHRAFVSHLRTVLTARDAKACSAWTLLADHMAALCRSSSSSSSDAPPPSSTPATASSSARENLPSVWSSRALERAETHIDRLVAASRRFSVAAAAAAAAGATTSTSTSTSSLRSTAPGSLSPAPTASSKEDILTIISQQRLRDVAESRKHLPLSKLKERLASAPRAIDFPARLQAGQPMAVMAEVKRASPSRGDIAPEMKADEQALRYAKGGAAAISVLTEPTWFKGSLQDLQAARTAVGDGDSRPAFLRKDFILDEYQVYEARVYGADTCLLIVAILSDDRLSALMSCCRSLGMEPLVEVANAHEMQRAVAAGAKVIGINNRNLKDFSVDPNTTASVVASARASLPSSTILCALSGISTRLDVQRYRAVGCKAVLVGEALMRARDPARKIAQLRGVDAEHSAPLVKICGVKTTAMALAAAAAGADMVGLVFAEGSSRQVPVKIATAIAAAVRGISDLPRDLALSRRHTEPADATALSGASDEGDQVKAFYSAFPLQLQRLASYRPLVVGVFANQDPETVASIAASVPLDVIQLSGTEGMDAAKHFDDWLVMKAVHIEPGASAAAVAARVFGVQTGSQPDAVLLDTKCGSAMGGTGVVFDHTLAADLVQQHSLPLFLAGGLSPDNITEAVSTVHPLGVDVSSGVETSKEKDEAKIRDFIRKAKLTTQ